MAESLSLSNIDFPEDEFEDSGSQKEHTGTKYATFGVFQLVGNGVQTNRWCGKFSSYRGCVRVDLHKGVTLLNGTNYTGKAYVEIRSHSCHKPSCPVCYLSWASRAAHKIEGRLAEAAKRFGNAEHIVVSPPIGDYSLRYEDLRKKVVKIVKSRGVIGGCLIFHGFRYNNVRLWYWSPHFHVVGVIKGGYGCRNCERKWNCLKGCGGFDDRNWQAFQKDGYIVKVLGKRKTIFGTAWYQLNHSTIRTNVKRPHAFTWFGVCSYRKLKVKVEKKKSLCPICGEELVKLHHLGVRHTVKERGSPEYVGSFVDDLVDSDGALNWCEASSGSYG